MRIDIFEFEDFKWFPDFLRRGMMDYLRYFFTVTDYYGPVAPLLHTCLETLDTNRIIDLCSGAGGPILKVQKGLFKSYGMPTEVLLTDLYPNDDSCTDKKNGAYGTVDCVEESVDATAVPVGLQGIRTLFSSVHHFNPDEVRQILHDAAKSGQGIAIFDIGSKNLVSAAGILIFHPILILLLTPFFRPFRVETIIFTYFIPIIPFCTVWDGLMSILRLYDPAELLAIANGVNVGTYSWRSGKVRNKLGLKVTYLIGLPQKAVV